MYVRNYQIHNVLNVYRRQLSQGKSDPPKQVDAHHTQSDTVTTSDEGHNRSTMKKVAANVLKKITDVNPESDFGQEIIKQVQSREKDSHAVQKESAFIFNTIVGKNQKETRSLAVNDSLALINRLAELARTAVKGKAE